jgi:Skp family chaperone for outer membrane proteins
MLKNNKKILMWILLGYFNLGCSKDAKIKAKDAKLDIQNEIKSDRCNLDFDSKLEVNSIKKPINNGIIVRIIDDRKIFEESIYGKKIKKELSKKRTQIEEGLRKIENRIDKELALLKSEARTGDSDHLENRHQKIIKMKKDRDLELESVQEKFSQEVNKQVSVFNKKLQHLINSVSKDLGWHMVLLKDNNSIMYSDPDLDETELFIQKMNNEKLDKSSKNKDEK